MFIFRFLVSSFLFAPSSAVIYYEGVPGQDSVDQNGNPMTPRNVVVDNRTDAERLRQAGEELRMERAAARQVARPRPGGE